MLKTAYEVLFSSEVMIRTMLTTISLLYTAVVVNLLHASPILNCWKHRNRRHDLPQVWAVVSEPLHLDGLMFLHLNVGKLRTRVRFNIAQHRAIDSLSGAEFENR